MNPFSNYLLYLVFLLFIVGLWSLYAEYRFTRFEGKVKRGLMIWTEPLSWETRQFLENLPSSLQFEQSFIRKDLNEVLIVAKRSFWGTFFQRRNRLPYVAYVNLSAPENQIELRVSFLTPVTMVINLTILLFIFANIFIINAKHIPIFAWFIPLFFLSIWIGSFIFSHYRERRYLLDFLNQAMNYNSPNNVGSIYLDL